MQELSFKLSHFTLRGLAFGDANKPMILALHGWLDNAASFIPLSHYLHEYYIVALDMAGHGHSDHRAIGNHYHLLDFVYDIHELVESQQWHNFILMGHSMGGIIASLYASCFNQKVTKLISIESLGPLTKDPYTSSVQLRESIQSRLAANQSPAKHPSSLARTIEARAKAGDMSLSSAELLIKRNVQCIDGQYYFRSDRRLRTLSSLYMTEQQAEAFLCNIRSPMLVIQATQGFVAMRETMTQRHAWVPLLSYVECAGHHHLHMDQAVEIAKQIRGFL